MKSVNPVDVQTLLQSCAQLYDADRPDVWLRAFSTHLGMLMDFDSIKLVKDSLDTALRKQNVNEVTALWSMLDAGFTAAHMRKIEHGFASVLEHLLQAFWSDRFKYGGRFEQYEELLQRCKTLNVTGAIVREWVERKINWIGRIAEIDSPIAQDFNKFTMKLADDLDKPTTPTT